jgi:hypothetical protein
VVGCSTVYVRLLDEGTDVFRPVPAKPLRDSTYLLGGEDIFDSKDELWEFSPGATVDVESKILSGEMVLVAVGKSRV